MRRVLIAMLALAHAATPLLADDITQVVPGKSVEEARPFLEGACEELVIDGEPDDETYITCHFPSGNLITANASPAGTIYWVTYREGSDDERDVFVDRAKFALGFEGDPEACVSINREAQCWRRDLSVLYVLDDWDWEGRWVAIIEDEGATE